MATATARVTKPAKRKGRAVAARPDQNIHYNGTDTDSITTLRRQHLALLGLSDIRADLVASLAWGALA